MPAPKTAQLGQIRDFDDGDWCCFAGCTTFPDNGQPMAVELECGLLIADPQGLCLMPCIEDDPQSEYGGYIIPMDCKNRAAMRFIMESYVCRCTTIQEFKDAGFNPAQ